jgi:hypothetical protein
MRCQLAGGARIGFHQRNPRSSTRSRLESERTAASEQVEAMQSVEVLTEPVEDGLAYPVRRRAQALDRRNKQLPSTPLPADDA